MSLTKFEVFQIEDLSGASFVSEEGIFIVPLTIRYLLFGLQYYVYAKNRSFSCLGVFKGIC